MIHQNTKPITKSRKDETKKIERILYETWPFFALSKFRAFVMDTFLALTAVSCLLYTRRS
jgi:hypothetical protein